MYKGNITTGTALTDNVNIPISTVLNTNDSTRINSTGTGVQIFDEGIYDVKASLSISNATASPLTLQLFANDVAIADCVFAKSTTTIGTYTFVINNIIRVSRNTYGNYATISMRILGGNAVAQSTGSLIIEKRR